MLMTRDQFTEKAKRAADIVLGDDKPTPAQEAEALGLVIECVAGLCVGVWKQLERIADNLEAER